MGKHLFRIITLAVVIFALFGILAILRRNSLQEGGNKPVPIFASETPISTSSIDVLSPDGKVTLTMKEKKVEAGVVHTFSVSNKEIFSKTLPKDSSLTIPFNAFSPDNKYIFLKKTVLGKVDYFVFPFSEGTEINFSGLFTEKFGSELTIEDATGWGGVDLVVINTQKVSGGKGPSFWFEVPSRSFIRLSHAF